MTNEHTSLRLPWKNPTDWLNTKTGDFDGKRYELRHDWTCSWARHFIDYGVRSARENAECSCGWMKVVTAVNAHDDLVAALRAVEWSGVRFYDRDDYSEGVCPECESKPHDADCQLDAALDSAKETPA